MAPQVTALFSRVRMRVDRCRQTCGRIAKCEVARSPTGASARARTKTCLGAWRSGSCRLRSIRARRARSCAGSTENAARERRPMRATRQAERLEPLDHPQYWQSHRVRQTAACTCDWLAWPRTARAGEEFRCDARVLASGQLRSCGSCGNNSAMSGRRRQ